MLRQIRPVGIAAVAALAVAVFAFNSQNSTISQKKDIRMLKGTMPGGVTLYGTDETVPLRKGREIATFAAGCFWGIEDYFRQVEGVTATAVGFSGGTVKNPTYKQVCYMATGHAEAVRVEFDPKLISYEKLLEVFWKVHDPCQVGGQGPDMGDQYRSVVFYHNEKQRETATKSMEELQRSRSKRITTTIVPVATFWMAEEYHQQYCLKNGIAACPIPGSKGGGH